MILSKLLRLFSGERTIISTNDFGELYIHMEENEVGPLPYMTYKN